MSDLLRHWGYHSETHEWKPAETKALPVDENPIGSALAYLAVLAYPDSKEKRNKFIQAGIRECNRQGRVWCREYHKGEETPENMTAIPDNSKQQNMRTLRHGLKRIFPKRIIASNWAHWLSKGEQQQRRDKLAARIAKEQKLKGRHQMTGLNVRLNGKAPTLNEIIKHSSRDLEKPPTVQNLYKNIWIPSKPVIHLAMAFEHEAIKKGGITANGWFDLLSQPEWVKSAIELSNHTAVPIPEDPRATFLPSTIDRNQLIKLEEM